MVLCLGLSVLGCLAVFNATYHLAEPYRFVGRQLLWLPPGAIFMVAVAAMPARQLRSLTVAGAIIGYAALLAVLAFGVGVNGVRSGFAWGGVYIQPAELAKPFFVLSLALAMQKTSRYRDDWLAGSLPPFGLLLVWVAPLLLQPDFGTALVYTLTFAMVFVCLGGSVRHLGLCLLAGLPPMALLVRFGSLLAPRLAVLAEAEQATTGRGWHVVQFQHALADGGFFGQGMGRTIESQYILPSGHGVSVVANLGQAMGLLGLASLLLILMAWVFYGWRRAREAAEDCEDEFQPAAILGLTTVVAVQACLHLSTNIGLLPSLDIGLPLLGYGGSSLLMVFIVVGMVESLGRPHISD